MFALTADYVQLLEARILQYSTYTRMPNVRYTRFTKKFIQKRCYLRQFKF